MHRSKHKQLIVRSITVGSSGRHNYTHSRATSTYSRDNYCTENFADEWLLRTFSVLRDKPSLGLVAEESKPASRSEVQYTVELEATS